MSAAECVLIGDTRNYRVSCDKIRRVLPEFHPEWTVRRGVEELFDAYRREGLTIGDFETPRFLRIEHVKKLLADGLIDDRLHWLTDLAPAGEAA